jgi:hypothetical protein
VVTLNIEIQANHLKDDCEVGTGKEEEGEEGRRQEKENEEEVVMVDDDDDESRVLQWAGYMVRLGEMWKAYRILVEKSIGK